MLVFRVPIPMQPAIDPLLKLNTEAAGAVAGALLEMGADTDALLRALGQRVSDDAALEKLEHDPLSVIGFDTPPEGLGDLAFPCFPLAPLFERAPGAIAAKLAESIAAEGLERLEVNAAGPYLNFSYRPEPVIEETLRCIQARKSAYGDAAARDERVVLEHTSANPNGPFHVGRARNPIIGDTMARVLRAAGYDVETEYWVNDVGKQVAILTWGVMELDEDDLARSDPGSTDRDENENKIEETLALTLSDKPDHRLVSYYQQANRMMEADPTIEEEINAILRLLERQRQFAERETATAIATETATGTGIDTDSDTDTDTGAKRDTAIEAEEDAPEERIIKIARSVRATCENVLGGMKQSLQRLNISLDRFVYESESLLDGAVDEVIAKLSESEYSHTEPDGARYIEMGELGVAGRNTKFVYTRSDGTSLYTTRDLGYHLTKLRRCDRAINILGEDHRLQAQQLGIALELIGVDPARLPESIFYSFVSLPEGRMSTRQARVVYLDDLMAEAVYQARKEVEKRRDELDEERIEAIAEIVGLGALRYNIIRVKPEKKITFKWEEALNFDGDSAPFVQYAHARACSIIRKAQVEPGARHTDESQAWHAETLTDPYAYGLIRSLAGFPRVVRACAMDRAPHLLTEYAHELSSRFNAFYRECPVIHADDAPTRASRLVLVDAVRCALERVLNLIGITAPEEM